MHDPSDPEKRLLEENSSLKQRIRELEAAESQRESREREQRIFSEILQTFVRESGEGLYDQVLKILLETFVSELGVVGYLDEGGNLVCPSMTHHVWDRCAVPDKDIVFPETAWGESIWGRVLKTGVPGISDGPFRVPEGHVPIINCLSAPMIYQGKQMGLLTVANRAGGYSESDRALLTSMADTMAPLLYARVRRMRTEEALRKSEARLAEAERLTHLGFWHWDIKTGDVEWSDEVYRIFQLDPTEFKPHIDAILARSPWPEHNQRNLELINRAVENHREGFYEQKILHPDGTIAYYFSTFHGHYDEDGQLVAIFGTAVDTTERRRAEEALQASEQKYRTLTEQMPDFVWHKDMDGVYLFANSNYARACGHTPETIAGHCDEDFYPPALAAKYTADDRTVIETGWPLETEEMWESAGDKHWLHTSKAPLLDEGGRCIGTIGIGRDITEQKRLAEERQELSERLQRSEKMEALGTLAGGVAHDLNNVLGILVGYSELLLCDLPKGTPLRGHVEQIMNGGMRAAAVVQDLLTLARRGIASEAVLNLNAVVTDFLKSPEFDSLRSRHSRVRVKTELAADLENIKGSEPHLFKTVANLLINAAEAMPEGGMIVVSTENCILERPVLGYDDVQEGEYAVLSISDMGEGIADADIRHIFEPFYTKKVLGQKSGTGLGLAVVWGTVKDHSGYIDVRSKLGRGTIFTLYFPVTRETVGPDATVRSVAEYMGNGESILVVDDVAGQRDLAAGMLGRLLYRVHTAASGEEAVEYLRTHAVDLVVLDMIMDPGMDGLDTYNRILEIHPKQKAVIVSGFSESDRVRAAEALGAGAYVRKPYSLEKLGVAVQKVLALP